jgi:predicted nucleic acid-binding protein
VPPPSAVSNTGPLIALAKVDLLPMLRSLFGRVRVPPAVQRELLAGTGDDVTRLQLAFADFLDVEPPPAPAQEVSDAVRHLGAGEQEAVRLALHLRALLLIDDHAARSVAKGTGLAITGTAGVLIQAKAAGLVPAVSPVLIEMRAKGYWLSDGLLDAAARMAGE